MITVVKGRRPKRAHVVSAPCVVTHGTALKVRSFHLLWVLYGLAQTGLFSASPACFSPSSFSIFTSTLAISSAQQDSLLFFPLCLAFLTAAKLCWFPRVSPALIVCFCPSSTFISFGSSSPFFHYFKLVRDVVSLDFAFMVFRFFSFPSLLFLYIIKINHFGSFQKTGWVSYGLYYHY